MNLHDAWCIRGRLSHLTLMPALCPSVMENGCDYVMYDLTEDDDEFLLSVYLFLEESDGMYSERHMERLFRTSDS
jgi:hypothetical protein